MRYVLALMVTLMLVADADAGKNKSKKAGKNPRAKFKDVGGTADLFGPYFQRKRFHKGSHGFTLDSKTGKFIRSDSKKNKGKDKSKDIDLRKWDPNSLKPRHPDKLHVNPGPGGAGDVQLDKREMKGRPYKGNPSSKPKPRLKAINGGKMTAEDWDAPDWVERFRNSSN